MAFVELEEIEDRLDSSVLPLSTHDQARVVLFIADAESKIRDEFEKEFRDLDSEVITTPWLSREVSRVVREMAMASVIIGPNVGLKSVTSTTGPQSDGVVFESSGKVNFSGPILTDAMRNDLGLSIRVRSRGRFPRPAIWPERRHW